jgi:hypothetical protein
MPGILIALIAVVGILAVVLFAVCRVLLVLLMVDCRRRKSAVDNDKSRIRQCRASIAIRGGIVP